MHRYKAVKKHLILQKLPPFVTNFPYPEKFEEMIR